MMTSAFMTVSNIEKASCQKKHYSKLKLIHFFSIPNMYNDYKIVVVTAAGRRRYMQYLVPFIVSSPIVDRYDIWINTNNNADIAFFRKLAEKFSVINLVWQPERIVNGISSINSFYRQCIDNDTIYFKIDDDIIWMEPNLIEEMVKFRIDNPDYFLVTPLVINNSLSTYLLQIEKKILLDKYYSSTSSHPVLWGSGEFARELHMWFLNSYLRNKTWNELHLDKKEMGMTRFSINAILWYGKDLSKINGIVPGDDEEFMSCIYPSLLGKSNAWNGNTIAVHFAFFTQREVLDNARILEQYGEICHKFWSESPKLSHNGELVSCLMRDIDNNESYYLSQPLQYKTTSNDKTTSKKLTRKERILNALPQVLVKLLVNIKGIFVNKDNSQQHHIIS